MCMCVVSSMLIDIIHLVSLSFLVSVAKQVTVHSVAGDVSYWLAFVHLYLSFLQLLTKLRLPTDNTWPLSFIPFHLPPTHITLQSKEDLRSIGGKKSTNPALLVPCFQLKDTQLQGWMNKLGGSGLTPKNWRRRWFVLKDRKLFYYKTSFVSVCNCSSRYETPPPPPPPSPIPVPCLTRALPCCTCCSLTYDGRYLASCLLRRSGTLLVISNP